MLLGLAGLPRKHPASAHNTLSGPSFVFFSTRQASTKSFLAKVLAELSSLSLVEEISIGFVKFPVGHFASPYLLRDEGFRVSKEVLVLLIGDLDVKKNRIRTQVNSLMSKTVSVTNNKRLGGDAL